MIGYDLAYVAFAAVDRPHAGARSAGGCRGCASGARTGAPGARARPVELAPTRGLRAALARRAAWLRNSAVGTG